MDTGKKNSEIILNIHIYLSAIISNKLDYFNILKNDYRSTVKTCLRITDSC